MILQEPPEWADLSRNHSSARLCGSISVGVLFRGWCRGSTIRLRELTSQRPRVEARYLRSKDVVASANVNRL
jgi:hypothetical protein